MSDKRIELNGNEVVSLNDRNNQFLIDHSTFRVDEFWARLQGYFSTGVNWFNEGVDCEILYPGGLWKEGKVRIRIEFCPHESDAIDSIVSSENADSELENIRQMMNDRPINDQP